MGTMSWPRWRTQASASCPALTPFSAATSSTRSTSWMLRSKFSPWKRGWWRRKSSSGEVERRAEAPRQEATAERRVRDEADAQLAHGREDAHLGVARPERVLGLQRRDRVRGVGAPDRLVRRLREAEVAHLARVDELFHSADRLLDRHL